ncbi:hypothetical protein G6733_06710 [Polynucleobacter paneuropaeus]|nr:hypothetical protein G6733_06710 [Polynucleobacter paneuropaeus]
MKNFFRVVCLSTLVLAGCANNKPTSTELTPENKAEIQEQVKTVQKKMSACIAGVNKTDDTKYVDANIIVISTNNPNANKLFNSADFISDEQAVELKKFKEATMQCRPIAKELPKPELVAVYEYYYSKVDDVYNDLVNKRITIGVANQERQMRLHYTNDKWAQAMKTYQGG